MGRAQRHGELVRHLAAHGARLQVGEVMHLGAVATTDQTRPGSDPLEVIGIALTARLTHCKLRLVDPAAGLRPAHGFLERIDDGPGRQLRAVGSAGVPSHTGVWHWLVINGLDSAAGFSSLRILLVQVFRG